MSVASPGPSAPVQPATSKPTARAKPAMGISAGAEDSMYHSKYKVLKRKVKELEADNDRLLFKSLQAKRTVQRLKLERAILYERLVGVPASPDMPQYAPLPPVSESQATNSPHPPPHTRPPTHQEPPNSVSFLNNLRHHDPHSRTGPNTWPPEDRETTSVHGPSLAESRSSAPRHSESLPPVLHRPNGSVRSDPPQPTQPVSHAPPHSSQNANHPHATSPNLPGPSVAGVQERTSSSEHLLKRSAKSRIDYSLQPWLEPLPPVAGIDDPDSDEEEDTSRQRRHETHEYDKVPKDRALDETGLRASRGHPRQYDPVLHERGPPPPPPDVHIERTRDRESEVDAPKRHQVGEFASGVHSSERYRGQHSYESHGRQSSGRMHNHQRIGPGTYLNRPTDERHDHDSPAERERDWEYGHSQAPRPRQPLPPPPHYRDSDREQHERASYYDHPPPHPMPVGPSRSSHGQWTSGDTPSGGSGSASATAIPSSDIPPRPGSSGGYHKTDRHGPSRPYSLRPVPPDDQDYPMEEPSRNHYNRDYPRSGYQYPEVEHSQPPKKRSKMELSPDTVPVHFVDEGPKKIPVTMYDSSENPRPDLPPVRRPSMGERQHEEREEHDHQRDE